MRKFYERTEVTVAFASAAAACGVLVYFILTIFHPMLLLSPWWFVGPALGVAAFWMASKGYMIDDHHRDCPG